MVSASTTSDRLNQNPASLAYRTAYAAALTGSLVSAGLTYVYLQNGAHELNPVVRAVIAAVGLEGMVAVKTGIVVGCYHGYLRLVPPLSTNMVLAFAWIGSAVNLANAIYDLSVAVRAGPPPVGDLVTGTGLVLAAIGFGIVFRPDVSHSAAGTDRHRSAVE